ncbi:HYC_CC_PP family protein [Parasediminibacterium sp. JCM 36343]|uniref:HYC_CC_PP family protein n=1 Tax=Parasediminibacterium sp. JCM 36343 TaxID=3374279 RepID=UPI003977F345
MKKLLLILFAAAYIVAALGVNLHFFYCCEKLSSVSISQAQPVDNCVHTTKKGCCTNKTVNIKLTTDQEKVVEVHNNTPLVFTIPANNYFAANDNIQWQKTTIPSLLPLSPPCFPSRQILFCIFRI